MKLKNAIAQLEKHIGPVNATPHGKLTRYRAVPPSGRTGIEFLATKGSDEVRNLRVRTEGVGNEGIADYSLSYRCQNMKQLIECFKKHYWPSDTRED